MASISLVFFGPATPAWASHFIGVEPKVDIVWDGSTKSYARVTVSSVWDSSPSGAMPERLNSYPSGIGSTASCTEASRQSGNTPTYVFNCSLDSISTAGVYYFEWDSGNRINNFNTTSSASFSYQVGFYFNPADENPASSGWFGSPRFSASLQTVVGEGQAFSQNLGADSPNPSKNTTLTYSFIEDTTASVALNGAPVSGAKDGGSADAGLYARAWSSSALAGKDLATLSTDGDLAISSEVSAFIANQAYNDLALKVKVEERDSGNNIVGFVTRDLGITFRTTTNTAPTLSGFTANQEFRLVAGTDTATTFTITATDAQNDSLTIALGSTFPSTSWVATAGTQSNSSDGSTSTATRVISLKPGSSVPSGTTTVEVTVTDDGGTSNDVPLTTSRSFRIIVVNAPQIQSTGDRQVAISWVNPTLGVGETLDGTKVQYSSDSGATWTTFETVSGSGTSSTVTGLSNGAAYVFRTVPRIDTSGVVADGTESSASESATPRAPQTISWAPSTSLVLADSGLTLSATVSVGDGSLSYQVVSAGTTGCSVSGSTLTFSATGSNANGCEIRPIASQTTAYAEKSDAATVTFNVSRGTFAISSSSTKVASSEDAFTSVCTSTCDISGFVAADSILVVISAADGSQLNGRIRLTSDAGLTDVDGYDSNQASTTGLTELAFVATQSQANSALETLEYKSPSGGAEEAIGISATLSGAAYFAGTGHYYQFVDLSTDLSWTAAKAAAASATFNGLTGYLATITSAEENAFVQEKTGSAAAWVGGSDEYSQINAATGATTFANQTASEGHWYWVTGPEAGTEFWDEFGDSSAGADGRISGRYQNWNNAINSSSWGAEPNNAGSSEHYLQIRVGGAGNWNDLPNSSLLPYVIEFGGNGGTVLKEASTSFTVGVVASGGTPSNNSTRSNRPAVPVVVSPSPSPPGVFAQTPRQLNLPVENPGPVIRNGQLPAPPSVPQALIGGRSATVTTTVPTTTQLDVRAGAVNLGVKVQEDQGQISEAPDGTTEIAVRKGAAATITGSGFRPGATVQVFMPLQGDNARELTRIPVQPDGSFDGSAPFATRSNEAPLPIGKNVLQLVSLDNDGNQVVVEMTVNIAQGAPAPEQNRIDGVIPTMTPGQSVATSGGEPVPVRITPVAEQKLAVVEGDGWSMAVNVAAEDGGVEPSEGGALLKLVRNESALVSGSGFMPGTRADVWLFSDPTLLGTVTIDENGEFTGEVNIDPNMIPVGEHTLQLQGVGEDGYVKAANMGVLVDDPVEAAPTAVEQGLGFIWWIIAAIVLLSLIVVLIASRRRRDA